MARIYVTGFSCFGDVKYNPTEELLHELSNYAADDRHEENTTSQATIIGTKCLKVSAISVRQWIKHELYPSLDKLENSDHLPIVIVHLGVDEKSQQIKLETRAYNEAKFRIPDQIGWQPEGIPINNEEECSYFRTTKVPVGKLAEALQRKYHSDVLISEDAGRYVCNYSYFISLEEAAKRQNMFSLFVHVPLFSCLSKEEQLAFLQALFEELASTIGSEREGGEEGEPGGEVQQESY